MKKVLSAVEAEAVARIKCDIGIENVVIRPYNKKWVIARPLENLQFEIIYSALTQDECVKLFAACV